MALPATEAFTDSDSVQLTTHDSSWTLNSGDFDIFSNQLRVDDAGNQAYIAAHWNADSFDDDQYAEAVAKLQTAGDWNYLGVSVRCAAAANTFYSILWASTASGQKVLSKVVAGSQTTILSGFGAAWSANAVLRLEAEGTTLRVYDDGVQEGGDQTDATIGSGSAGVAGWDDTAGNNNNTLYDDWEGGNLAVSYTLTADQGNYILTGQLISLPVAKKVIAIQGSYALTGQIVTLPVARAALIASQGNYILTGQAVNLPIAWQAGMVQGNYVLSGQDVTLIASIGAVLVATQGFYVLTGQAVTLLLAWILTINQGNYTLTGQTVIFSFSGEVIQIYTADVIVNLTPTIIMLCNILPNVSILANPSPTKEVEIG